MVVAVMEVFSVSTTKCDLRGQAGVARNLVPQIMVGHRAAGQLAGWLGVPAAG